MSFLKGNDISDFTFQASKVWINKGMLNVSLIDGRIISNPLSLYPFLLNISEKSLNNFRLFGEGTAIHFKDIDEDISVTDIVLGVPYRDEKNTPPLKETA